MRIANILIVVLLALGSSARGQVVINEINISGTDWFELFNLGGAPVNLGGWQVFVSGDNGANGPVTNSFTFPANTVIGAGALLVVTESTSLAAPTVPAGVPLISFGGNIFWHGSAVGEGGVCTLTDGVDGIDTVNWLSPANTDPVPPATFPVSIPSLNGDAIYRNSFAVNDTVADWNTDNAASPGDLNPGQEPPPGLEIVLSFTPTTFNIDVNTAPNPVPGGEIYCLFSSETWVPAGTGPLFGVGLDAFDQLLVPLAFGLPFHALLDANGDYSYSFLFPVPPGLHIEAVSILVENMALSRVSDVFVFDS